MWKSKKRKKILAVCLIATLIFSLFARYRDISTKSYAYVQSFEDALQIHIIDVGQAEAILIVQGDHAMLVDSGRNSTSKEVVEYIEDLGISTLDLLVITHFHRDHAGGIYSVISSFDVQKIICSDFYDLSTWQERWYYLDMSIARVIKNIFKRSNIIMETAKNDDGSLKKYSLGNATIEILSQNDNEEIVNNKSIVFKLSYDNFSMLFMGDAQFKVEKELLECGVDVSADVLKVGHHGSHTSTLEEFLEAVDPTYAVISCGRDNDYGHPSSEVMKRLEMNNVEVYRTDESGTIVITVEDGGISFNKKQGSYLSGD